MNGLICETCRCENNSKNYFCKKCGHYLRENELSNRMISSDMEMKLNRIIGNLQENPHYDIIWNETVNAYTRKVERIQSLLRIKDMGVESNELDQNISDFLNLCRKPDFQIAFVGTIKTGKSTLINSLLGHNYASIDVTPETAALTKFRSSENDYVHVTFYSANEWKLLWNSVQKEADKFLQEYYNLQADKQKEKWVGHKEEHKIVPNIEIEKELSIWSSSKSAIHYFVKEIEVGISTLPKEFPKQVVFVDTPGLSDPVEFRSQISRDYIHKANAVFVCVDAAKMYKEEIETIASVFSFSAHNKNKVHVIATHWDTLNDPISDWKKQSEYMAEQLTGKAFYDTKEMAMKNILYAAAYIYNLCRDYNNLEGKEKKIVNILPMKLDMDVEIGMLTQSDIKQLMEITNIHNINQIIVDELVLKYSQLLYGDIENLYKNIKYIVNRVAGERNSELDDRIAISSADMHKIKEKLEMKIKDRDDIKQTQEQLKAALKSLDKSTKRRLDIIMSQMQ